MRVGAQVNASRLTSSNLNTNGLRRRTSDKPLLEKIKFVVKAVFATLLSLVLFCINPAIFFISFVIGIAFKHAIHQAVERIKDFMIKYKWPVVAGSVVMAIVILPVFVAVGSVIWSANLGSYLARKNR